MKRLIPLGSMIGLLISSANVFALPKIKRIRISRTGTRLQRIAKETIVNGKLRYIRHGVSETTRATASTTAQQVERAAEQAQQSHAKAILPAVTNLEQRAAAVEKAEAHASRVNTLYTKRGGRHQGVCMKKLIACSSVAVLMLSTLNVYAGPKFKKGKTNRAKRGARVVKVSPEMLHAGNLRYILHETEGIATRAKPAHTQTVSKGNSLTTSHANKGPFHLDNAVTREVSQAVAQSRLGAAPRPEFTWKEVYTEQADLARDVDRFYDGKGGEPYIGVTGENLVLYRLPEEISYHPTGSVFPRTLNPQKEFILYNPATRKGQIVSENMLRLFQKAEPVQAEGSVALEEMDAAAGLAGDAAPEGKAPTQAGTPTQPVAAPVKEFVGQEVYEWGSAVARDVALYYEGKGGQLVQDQFGRDFVLYELPKDGIVYRPYGKSEVKILTRDKYIIVYNLNNNAGQLMEKQSHLLSFLRPVEE